MYCLAAFRSTRGSGVRLLFRIPPCTAEEHRLVFEQVARHVRAVYGYEADASGRDVARASFVSFDEELWCYPAAQALPITVGMSHSSKQFRRSYQQHSCVTSAVYGGELATTTWAWLGRNHAETKIKSDRTVSTHGSLMELGKAMALQAHRLGYTFTNRDYREALQGWHTEHQRKGRRLRRPFDKYLKELRNNIESAKRKPWFAAAADKWTRWRQKPDFPSHPKEQLWFAIRKHCEAANSKDFFLSSRDAGLLCATTFRTGARLLSRLVNEGKLKLLTIPENRPVRHAYEYRLIDDGG
jgi:VirE N-terminal domain